MRVKYGIYCVCNSLCKPFTHLFYHSPTNSWPQQVRVVGTFTDKKVVEQSIRKQFDVTPFRDLIAWLDQPGQPAPIFVGFGSMVIDDPTHLAELIMSAADKAQCRVVVQSSWTKIDVSASSKCHMVGPCPHDWLLPQMCAVVHHGGAGTTAAGLRWSKPTFICPFFGDQHMWGDMVRRAGVGPPPCPVGKLTDDILAANFKVLLDSTWPACTAPSPDDVEQRPFEADAIIANPPVFGHIHVAEALGIPLHIMFPQPWYYGTRQYPHPCIGLPYHRDASDANFHSYSGFEGVVWSSMEQMMNGWRRKTLDVPVVHFGMGASTLIPDAGVSFSAMWSPAFVPKPEE